VNRLKFGETSACCGGGNPERSLRNQERVETRRVGPKGKSQGRERVRRVEKSTQM